VVVVGTVGLLLTSGWVSAPFVLVPSDGVFARFDLAAPWLPQLKWLFFCLMKCNGIP
jgi:hypothetical protein